MNVRKVLIYRLGSLGDTVVALPCMHMIARAFPDAERRLLTNFPVSGKGASMEAIIGGSNLAHGYFKYPLGSRSPGELWALRQAISRWSPDVLVYLAAPRGRLKVYRDSLFFQCCGIRTLIGVPYSACLQNHLILEGTGRFESETHRLARCIQELGDVQVDKPESWDLCLNASEAQAADGLLPAGKSPFLVVCVGTKVEVNDWGEDNWVSLLSRISFRYPDLGLVLVGSEGEKIRSGFVAESWNGPKRNLCGLASPRVSAAVLSRSILFVGHDSGPMHLAAACRVPCVAVFSARNQPGVWFPSGPGHRVIYHRTDCGGCRLERCLEHEKKCITSIKVEEVFDAVCDALSERNMIVT